MEVSTSTIINNFQTGQACTLVLKFVSYVEKENCHTFFVKCKSLDGYDVACLGRLSLKSDELSYLKTNDILQFKNVVTGELRRNDGVKHDFKIEFYSEVHILLNSGASYQILPSQKTGISSTQYSAQLFKPLNFINDLFHVLPDVKMPTANPDNSIIFKTINMNDDCTVTLKIESYIQNNNLKLIFINCKTFDNKSVAIATDIRRHTEELKKNDVVSFKNVKRCDPKKNDFGLKFNEKSHVFLCSRNDQNYDPPLEILNAFTNGEKKENNKKNRQKNSSKSNVAPKNDNNSKKKHDKNYLLLPDVPTDDHIRHNLIPETGSSWNALFENKPKTENENENEKVIGKLTSDLQKIKHYQTQNWIYKADMILDDKSKIILLIDAEYGKWPSQLLKKGHRVSVGGKKEKYFQQEARYVTNGDDFDIVNAR